MVLVSRIFVPKGYSGITLYPFIFLKSRDFKRDLILLNHEEIHLRQQLELLIIPFFVWYVLEYLFKIVKYKNHLKAYQNISFEVEAYQNEKDLEYLKSRSFWNFLKYL